MSLSELAYWPSCDLYTHDWKLGFVVNWAHCHPLAKAENWSDSRVWKQQGRRLVVSLLIFHACFGNVNSYKQHSYISLQNKLIYSLKAKFVGIDYAVTRINLNFLSFNFNKNNCREGWGLHWKWALRDSDVLHEWLKGFPTISFLRAFPHPV